MTVRDTSLSAYRAIAPDCESVRRMILWLAAMRGDRGITADEAADTLGFAPDIVRPRFTELADAGKIVANGERRVTRAGAARARNGKSATKARVMVIATKENVG